MMSILFSLPLLLPHCQCTTILLLGANNLDNLTYLCTNCTRFKGENQAVNLYLLFNYDSVILVDPVDMWKSFILGLKNLRDGTIDQLLPYIWDSILKNLFF